MSPNRLIVFTKYPKKGYVKTRLIPSIGAEKATFIHRYLAENTVKKAHHCAEKENLYLQIFFTGGDIKDMQEWLGKMSFAKQCEGSLGDKMSQAFKTSFTEKANKVIIIGADIPFISSDIISKAFTSLEKSDVVIGPADDGGYYLIGLKKRADYLFKDVGWGKERVFYQTREKALKKGLQIKTLGVLADLDRPEDLKKFKEVEFLKEEDDINHYSNLK